MQYRRLGTTGLRVSVIGIGGWQLGGEWGKQFMQDEVDRMLARAQELGINLIDTAECYGDHKSESLIGGATHRQRDKWIIATKFGHRFTGHLGRAEARSPADLARQLEASLKALRTDYVDLLQYHSIRDEEFDNEELQQAVIKLKRQGKVRHIGNSVATGLNFAHQVDASANAEVETVQLVYNRLDRRAEQTAFESCIRQNLGVLIRAPLASGFLGGRYKPGAKFAIDDFRASKKSQEIDQTLREVEQIARAEVPPGAEMSQWALAWCLQHPAVTCVIPGCKSVEQVESNARAAERANPDHPQVWKE